MSNGQNFPGKDDEWHLNLPKSNIPTDPNEYIDNQQYHQRRSSHIGRQVLYSILVGFKKCVTQRARKLKKSSGKKSREIK